MDGVAYLITETKVQDSIGQFIVGSREEFEIFVEERSITRQEWDIAGKSGLTPELVLITPRMNYSGQKTVRYGGHTYGIYRTYSTGEDIELYLERKSGLDT